MPKLRQILLWDVRLSLCQQTPRAEYTTSPLVPAQAGAHTPWSMGSCVTPVTSAFQVRGEAEQESLVATLGRGFRSCLLLALRSAVSSKLL